MNKKNFSKPFAIFLALMTALVHVEKAGFAQATTSQDVRHGIAQLEQVWEDRPDMRGLFPPGSPIYVWIENAFANTGGRRVCWDNREPDGKRSSGEFHFHGNGAPTSIRVTGSADVSPLDKYSMLISQFQSVSQIGEVLSVHTLAVSGKLNADEYAEKTAEVYFHTLVQTQAVLKAHRFDQLATDNDAFTNKVLGTPVEFETYLNQLKELPPGEDNELAVYKDWYEANIRKPNPAP
ncbi:MAG: hypothetical protein ACTHK7_04930 [Aureliella sp.]